MEMISVALKPGGERRTPGEEGSPPITKGTGIRKTTGSIRLLLPSMQMHVAVICKDLLAAPASLCGDRNLAGQHPVPPLPPAPHKDKAQRKFCWKCLYMGGCNRPSPKVRLGVPRAIAAGVWRASERSQRRFGIAQERRWMWQFHTISKPMRCFLACRQRAVMWALCGRTRAHTPRVTGTQQLRTHR